MNRYFIEDENGSFWCENNMGYWSNEYHPEWSIKHRFEGVYLWVVWMYLLMKLLNRELQPKIIRTYKQVKT